MSGKQNGTFQIFYKDGWACLSVTPPEQGGRPIYVESVEGRLKLLKIPSVRQQRIRDIIKKASGKPSRLIEWPDGEKLGPEIQVKIQEDNMSAGVIIFPERQGGEPLSIRMLREALTGAGVVSGIQKKAVQSILQRKIFNQSVLVAHGRPPIHEKTTKIEYLFETERGKPFRELEYQRIDLKELKFIQNKDAGDVLARLLPPVEPMDGEDIRGNILPAERGGDIAEIKAGEGTKLSPDGTELTAGVTGNVKFHRGAVMVEPVVAVENVDYSNGNIDFKGAVDITGRVADGFTVKAEGDIQIGKSVSRVYIESGGDMILKAGVSGNDEGVIHCGGDLYARYLENAEIQCKGNLYVEEAIMHCRIKVEKDIILSGKRAEIFGGRVIAGGSIRCKKLGSLNEPPTEIHLGLKIDEFNKHETLENTISRAQQDLDKADNQIRQIKAAMKKGGTAAPPLDIPREKLSAALTQLEEKSVNLNLFISEELRNLHEMVREQVIDENAHLAVEHQIFGHVTVHFGSHRWLSSNKGTSKTILMVKQGKLLEKGQE